MDFGRLGMAWDPESGRRRLVWAMVIVLAYSRHSFVWPLFRQQLADIIEGLEKGFAFFGGIPRYLVIDDFPAAVAGTDPLNPRLTRGFLEYAQYRGFFADPARPGHVKGVGKLYHWGGARPSRWRRQDQSDASGSAREDGRSRDRQFVLSSRASE